MKEIDLTKNQIIEPPVKAWVWYNSEKKAKEKTLLSIDHRLEFPYNISLIDGDNQHFVGYKNASLTDPRIKKLPKPIFDSVYDIDWSVWECTFKTKDEWLCGYGWDDALLKNMYSSGNNFSEIRQISLPENRFALRDCIRVEWPVIRCKKDIKELDEDVWGVNWRYNKEPKDYTKPNNFAYNLESNSYWIKHLQTGQTKQVEAGLLYELPKQKRRLELWEIPKYMRDNPDLVLVEFDDSLVFIGYGQSSKDKIENHYTISSDKLASLGRMPTIEDCDKLEVEV